MGLFSARKGPSLDDIIGQWRTAAAQVIGEPVQDVYVFNRQGLLQNKMAGKFGALPYAMSVKHNAMKAAGLPQTFMLALTETQVRVLEYKTGMKPGTGTVGQELGSWERDDLQVSWKNGGPYMTAVTITIASEGETVQCSVGRTAEAEAFLSGMSTAPAA